MCFLCIRILKQAQFKFHTQDAGNRFIHNGFLQLSFLHKADQAFFPERIGEIKALDIQSAIYRHTDAFSGIRRHMMGGFQPVHRAEIRTHVSLEAIAFLQYLTQITPGANHGFSVNTVIGCHGIISAGF